MDSSGPTGPNQVLPSTNNVTNNPSGATTKRAETGGPHVASNSNEKKEPNSEANKSTKTDTKSQVLEGTETTQNNPEAYYKLLHKTVVGLGSKGSNPEEKSNLVGNNFQEKAAVPAEGTGSFPNGPGIPHNEPTNNATNADSGKTATTPNQNSMEEDEEIQSSTIQKSPRTNPKDPPPTTAHHTTASQSLTTPDAGQHMAKETGGAFHPVGPSGKAKADQSTQPPASNAAKPNNTSAPKGNAKGVSYEEDSFPSIGIKVTRVGNKGTTAYNPKDLQAFFHLLSKIDPAACLRNFANNPQTNTKLSKFATTKNTDRLKNYLDIVTTNWGRPNSGQERTSFSFYLQTNKIQPGLQDLRDDPDLKNLLKQGNMYLHYHQLHETQSKVVGYFFGKDPYHTYRQELASRTTTHLSHLGLDVRTQVIVSQVKSGRSQQARMCTLIVEETSLRKTVQALKDSPIPGLDFLMHSWIKENPEAMEKQIADHIAVVDQSKAIKLVNVESEQFVHLRNKAVAEKKGKIVDVCSANHSPNTGTVYVQFLGPLRDEITEWTDQALQSLPPAKGVFQSKPEIVVSAYTMATKAATQATTSEGTQVAKSVPRRVVVPNTCFAEILTKLPAPSPNSKAKSRATSRPPTRFVSPDAPSFLDIARGSYPESAISSLANSDSDGSDDSTVTRSNRSADDKSQSTIKTLQSKVESLETENKKLRAANTQTTDALEKAMTGLAQVESLKRLVEQLQSDNKAAKQQQQEERRLHQAQMEQMQQQQQDELQALKRQMEQLAHDSEPDYRRKQPAKKQDNKQTPTKGASTLGLHDNPMAEVSEAEEELPQAQQLFQGLAIDSKTDSMELEPIPPTVAAPADLQAFHNSAAEGDDSSVPPLDEQDSSDDDSMPPPLQDRDNPVDDLDTNLDDCPLSSDNEKEPPASGAGNTLR